MFKNFIHKSLLLISILCITCIEGVVKNENARIEGSKFVDPANTFSIMLPKDWTVQNIKSDDADANHEDAIMFVEPNKNGYLVLGPELPSMQAAEEVLSQMKQMFAGGFVKKEKIVLPDNTEIFGEIIGQCDTDGMKITNFLVSKENKKTVQTFLFSAKCDQFEKLLPIFKQMVISYEKK